MPLCLEKKDGQLCALEEGHDSPHQWEQRQVFKGSKGVFELDARDGSLCRMRDRHPESCWQLNHRDLLALGELLDAYRASVRP